MWLKKSVKSKGTHPGAGDGMCGPSVFRGMGTFLDNPDNVDTDFINDPKEIEESKRRTREKSWHSLKNLA